MPGISIHVVDVSRGIVAEGVRAELWSGMENAPFTRVLKGEIDERGLLAHPDLARIFAAGRYRAVFDVGGYYRGSGIAIGANPFLELVNFDRGIAVPEQHMHARGRGKSGQWTRGRNRQDITADFRDRLWPALRDIFMSCGRLHLANIKAWGNVRPSPTAAIR